MTNAVATQTAPNNAIPLVRVPILDTNRELFAYDIVHQHHPEDESDVAKHTLATITDGTLQRLTNGNRAYIRIPRDVLLDEADVFGSQFRLGLVVQPDAGSDPQLVERLSILAHRGRQLLLDAGDAPVANDPAIDRLLRVVQTVRLNASKLDPEVLRERTEYLHARGLHVVAGHVEDHATYHRCEGLPIQAIDGPFLMKPEPVPAPMISTDHHSLFKLVTALQEGNPGPVELGDLVRNDAVLSYKLLGCVNSAYFALPRQLKSVQQAAIFFGVARMRNWIYTMALINSSSSAPPELLRAALVRAHMFERLAADMKEEQREMAFTTGLLSLIDVITGVPLADVLHDLPLSPEIASALLERAGTFGALIVIVSQWEKGELGGGNASPAMLRRCNLAYQAAVEWADHVYSFSARQHN